ncbi:MAG TPA: hypothetical protein VGB55_07395 [Tepidisphaeraceae bacterium]|jgi:hypothetical protein
MSQEKDKLANALDAMMNGSSEVDGNDDHPSEAADAAPHPAPPDSLPAAQRGARPSAPVIAKPSAAMPATPTGRSARPSPQPQPSGALPPGRVAPPVKPAQPAPAADPVVDYAARKPAKKAVPVYATLSFRQTLIPPCLTLGVALLVLTILYFLQPPDSAVRLTGFILPAGMVLIGVILLAVAVLNMLMVQRELAERPAN